MPPSAGHDIAVPSLSVEDDTVYVPAPWGSDPNVMEPGMKVRAWAAAARTSTAVVQTTVSFVPVPVAGFRTQVAVVLPAKVLTEVADTADK